MIGTILSLAGTVAGRFFDNKDQKEEFMAELSREVISNESKLRDAQRDVIVAEAKGESWLQRNWRPVLMLVCIFIVANNYIIAPYMQLFLNESLDLKLDDNIWSLMKLGVGGYIAGRSGEKIMKEYKR